MRYFRSRMRVGAHLLMLAIALIASASILPSPSEAPAKKDFHDVRPWRFQPDPSGEGLKAGWHHPRFDDGKWSLLDFGRSWKDQGFAQYDGVAWYRSWITPPTHWSNPIIVVFRTTEEFDVFLNGVLLTANRTVKPQDRYDRFTLIELGQHLRLGQENSVVIRFRGSHGLTGPVRIGPRLSAMVEPEQYVYYLRRASPDWLFPTWVDDRPNAWTMLGVPAGARKALVGKDGTFSPRNPGYTIVPWVYDRDGKQLYAPHQDGGVTSSLHDGHLPIVVQSWAAGRARVETTTFVSDGSSPEAARNRQQRRALGESVSSEPQADPFVHYRLSISNPGPTPLALSLYFAIRPYDLRSTIWPVYRIEYQPDWQSVLINGRIGPYFARTPDGFGATTLETSDLSAIARQGALPAAALARDRDGLAMGAVRYQVSLPAGGSETFWLTIPVELAAPKASAAGQLADASFESRLAATEQAWRELVRRIDLELPEPAFVDAFYASVAYILIAQTGDRFHPGPLAHNASWTRDTAYITLALNRAGFAWHTRPALRQLLAAQRPSGEFPPIIELDGTPRDVTEWDSQGQGIFALSQHYRFTGDLDFLKESYPAIVRAADFIAHLRARQADAPVPFRGILPASLSAEDLGSAEWQHYWDDFWALAGLQEAREVAIILGDHSSAERFRREEDALREELLTSIRFMQKKYEQPQIPNGPHDIGNSSDARGTTPAIWPRDVLPNERQLLRTSFEHYFAKWVEPYGGGYLHHLDLIWPYGGLGLAQGYLRLGMSDKLWTILDWTMRNQTLPGVYAWAEAIHPKTGGFMIGDMPHGWFAAEYINLLRDILITERDDRLVIGAGVPLRWLVGDKTIAIDRAPTLYGLAGYRLSSNLTQNPSSPGTVSGTIHLQRLGSARPPRGFRLVLPIAQRPSAVSVDGKSIHVGHPQEIDLPTDFQEAVITYGP